MLRAGKNLSKRMGGSFGVVYREKSISISNSDGQPEVLSERARVGGKETSQVSTQ